MFKTVKSKILVITILMLAVLMAAFACYGFVFRMKTKQLMLQNYGLSVNEFVEKINDHMVIMEDNSRELAIIGKLFSTTDKNEELTKKVLVKIFENFPNSLGGGLWYEPYYFDGNQKRTCLYIFRNKHNQLLFDENFMSDEYDYHNQSWYKEIISQVTKDNDTAWSLPYYERIGSETLMITVGTGIFIDDKLVGISTVDWRLGDVFNEIMKMKPIEHGFSFYADRNTIKGSFAIFADVKRDYIIASNDPYLDNGILIGKSLKEIPWYNKNLKVVTYFDYHGRKYVPYVKELKNGMVLIFCIPKSEMFTDIDKFTYMMLIILCLLGLLIPALLYFSLNRQIITPISKLMQIAHKISKGENIEIKLEKPEEFARLASTFDKMTNNIKTITKDKAKIISELNIAKSIQESSLPSVFPPYPENKDFSIFASMEAAKVVGGDFYDFYFRDKDNFMFLIADVSGKGIPAALFMMICKTLINNLSQMNYEPKELFRIINNKICEANKQGFFVTMLAGIIDTQTGKLSLINCGHNLPLIKRNHGKYEYLQLDSNMVLGVFENTDFNIFETKLNEGDIIFTYTDGITEAVNDIEEMYGEERLKECLNRNSDITKVEEISATVKKDIKDFVSGTEQSDDITMMIFKYEKDTNKRIFRSDAVLENYKPFYSWLHNVSEEWKLNPELSNALDMCGEEIFANITFYAYPNTQGTIETEIMKDNEELSLRFEDFGVEYNPLEKPDPDITLPPEERQPGGLGIFMVKQMAKKVIYERKDGKNILTLTFGIQDNA